MRVAPFLALAALAACASHTDVVPLGAERYMVSYQQKGGFDSWTVVKGEAIKLADAHCVSMNKTMEVLSTQNSGARGWTPMNVEVTFTCH